MIEKPKRWFTCTPVAFGGGSDFFARDSGLLCRGLLAIGVEARAIMPGEALPDDERDLIRTRYENLHSANWWRGLNADGVVLYAWGHPRYRNIAKAIREAGVFLVLNQDHGGLVSPLADWRGWLEEQWILTGSGNSLRSRFGFIKRVIRGLTVGVFAIDPLRAAHLRCGDVIACVSPLAASHFRKLCRLYGGDSLAGRVRVIPHPVETLFGFDDSTPAKANRIVCIGRWQDATQKRPQLMQQVMASLLDQETEVHFDICGQATEDLVKWHASLPEPFRARIVLHGLLPSRTALAKLLQNARIFYSPSAFESFGIAAGEALCSGCSVVAARSPSMASFEWFVSKDSGRLAPHDGIQWHVDALRQELATWNAGQRNPLTISRHWQHELAAPNVASRVLVLKAAHETSHGTH